MPGWHYNETRFPKVLLLHSLVSQECVPLQRQQTNRQTYRLDRSGYKLGSINGHSVWLYSVNLPCLIKNVGGRE